MMISWTDIESELIANSASNNEINAKKLIFNSQLFQILMLTEFGIMSEKLFCDTRGTQGISKRLGVVDDLGALDLFELFNFIDQNELTFNKAATITPNQMAMLSDAQTKKVTQALISGVTDTVDYIRYSFSAIVQTGFPYTRVKGQQHFERKNGDLTVTMSAPNDIGLPYGIYPRLAFVHLCSEIVKNKARVINLGPSLKRFVIDDMGRPWSTGQKGTAKKWREALTSLLATSYTITYTLRDEQQRERGIDLKNVSLVTKAKLWWDPEFDGFDGALVEVSEPFAKALLEHATPLDIRALEQLAALRSPLAFDLYCWLTYRFWSMEERKTAVVRVSWQQLYEQLGTSIQTVRHFKLEARKALKVVKGIYPQANFQSDNDKYLILLVSPPHIPSRRQDAIAEAAD